MARIVGVGVDLCLSPRILATYKRFQDRFLLRAFHPSEIAEFHGRLRSDKDAQAFLASRCPHILLQCVFV